MMRSLSLVAAAISTLGITADAHAAITIYTSESSYLAAITNPATDTFQDIVFQSESTLPATRTVGSYGYTATAAQGLFGAGNSAADIWLSSIWAADPIVLSGFTGGVRGVGGYFFASKEAGNFGGAPSITISATDAGGSASQTIVKPSTTSFVGFVSTTGITTFTIGSPTTPGEQFFGTANDLILGGGTTTVSAVPEPATWAMMIAGFAMIGGALRRRRRGVPATAA